MKYILLLVSALSVSYACNTNSYYDATTGLTKYKLKTKLSQIITKGHLDQGYSALYNVYFTSDLDDDYNSDGSIMDIYSENPRGADPYSFKKKSHRCGSYRAEADCFNREHLFPQSIFNKMSPMKSDFFHIFPTDGYVNNKRGRLPFAKVCKANWTSQNGSKRGRSCSPGYSGEAFEPIDEFKGDVARALLYFATRYENRIANWTHAMLNHTRNQVYQDWFIKILLDWHKQDPVSKHEIKRNNHGFKFQGNRNPFIDHPEFAEMIWN